MPNGKIQPEFETRLREVGAWLQRYGESIYATRGGPVPPRPWGVTTQKGHTVYVHILDWPASDALWLPLGARVASARHLADGSPAGFTTGQGGILLDPVPERVRDANDTVIALELAR
jgi:alpha-L-fucosidase